jgi:uncharacterized membrane protein SirB2
VYQDVKTAHVLFAGTSLLLFALRWFAAAQGRRLPAPGLWRAVPPVVDTLLLACGVWLLVILRLNPLATPWLEVKLLCVLAYIILGVLAFRLPARWRPWLFASALLVFGFIVSVALTHDPRGIFSLVV